MASQIEMRRHLRRFWESSNTQESLGGDLQKQAPKAKLTIMETLNHIYRYTKVIETDFDLASTGFPLRYQKKSPTKRNRKKLF